MNDGGHLVISPHNSDIVFYVGNVYDAAYYLSVSHTSDGGLNWGHDTLGLMGSNAWAVAFDPVDPNRVYVGGDSSYSYATLLITTDLGLTWTSSHSGLVGKVYTLLTDPYDGQLVYAGSNNGVFKSTNAGQTWSATGLTVQTRTLALDPEHTECLYAGTYGSGVYLSSDYGANWVAMNTGLTNNKILSLDLRSGSEVTLFAGTEGGSVFRTTLGSGIFEGRKPQATSRKLALSVSPNPCHAATTIRFASSLSARATVTLYDASGRFVNSWMPNSSSFTVSTAQLTPGAYFVRLTDGTQTRTARLTVLE